MEMLDQILRLVFSPYKYWKKAEIYLKTYHVYRKEYHAPIWPLKIYWIELDEIECISKSISKEPVGIHSGDWDLHKKPLVDDIVFKSFRDHFAHDVEWDDTKYYDHIKYLIADNDSDWKGCETMTEANKRLAAYDELYDTIKSNGFKSQAELRNVGLLDSELRKLRYHPPELEDIAMNLSRNGEYMISNGVHRVSIAKILDIDQIPVRVRSRHEIWQQKRDKVWLGQEVQGSTYDHPDITPLL